MERERLFWVWNISYTRPMKWLVTANEVYSPFLEGKGERRK